MSLIIRWDGNNDRPITKEFTQALSADIGKTITDIIVTKRGGDPVLQGTWIPTQLAIHLAQ